MNPFAVLSNFRNYTPAQIAQLKQELHLTMSDNLIAFCIAHYKTYEKRDPHVDEIRLLDKLSRLSEENTTLRCITELSTNDPFVAETYADLLRKRKTLFPNSSHPCTVQEAIRTANAYLLRAGKSVCPIPATLLRETETACSVLPTSTCVGAPHSPYRLRVLSSVAVPQSNDLLILLTPTKAQSACQFQKVVQSILESPELHNRIRGVCQIRQEGLLCKLLEQFDNLQLDLSALSPSRLPMPMTLLVEQHYDGCYILRVAQNALALLEKVLPTDTIEASLLAQLSEKGGYLFCRGRGGRFSVNTHFLRTVFRRHACSANMNDEQPNIAPVLHRIVTSESCRYLTNTDGAFATETTAKNGITCTVASSVPNVSYFKTALYTAIIPVLALSACGIPTEEQQFCIGLDLPKDSTDPIAIGEILSTVLGIYRVQAEFGIPAQTASPIPHESAKHPHLTVFALGKGSDLPCTLTDTDNFVYCIPVSIDRNGLPVFSELRQLTGQLVHLNRTGAISSMRILCNESITDGLQNMRTTVHCHLNDLTVASEEKLQLAILLESRHALPYRRIGNTAENTAIPAFHNVSNRINSPDASLIWSQKAEIVLISKQQDTDAAALVTVLTEQGANVKHFSDDPKQADAMSRAILGSQTLILCPRVILPSGERIRFAINTMKTAGGNIFVLGKSPVSEWISLPHGFTAEILQKLCKKGKENPKKS